MKSKRSVTRGKTASPQGSFFSKLNGSGQSLPKTHEQFFKSRLNHDFSSVRIHTDSEAGKSASALHAEAYTWNNNIIFNKNKYQPETKDGRKLLAHELFHVMQQSSPATLYRQEQPTTEWIPPDIGQSLMPTELQEAMPMDPVERERWRREHHDMAGLRQDQLRPQLLQFVERGDAAGLMARLRMLSRRQAIEMLFDEEFMGMIRTRFRGVTLWSVFSVMLDRGDPDPLVQRLNVAIMSHQPQMVTDLLGLMRSSGYMNPGRRTLLITVLPQIFGGHPLLTEMLGLLAPTSSSDARHVSFRTRGVHYEQDEQGHMVLQEFGGEHQLDFRTTATQMRVVVPMDFVHATNHDEPFHFISGPLPGILDNWMTTIQRVWNNRFYLSNGHQNLQLVFVPIAVHAGPNRIEVHTNDSEHCPGISQRGRAESHCYFTSNSGNTIAHEFGHLIGASDEYNLPASAAEIPQSMLANMTAEDIRESTAEGIGQRRFPAVAGGHDMPDSLMSAQEASQRVYERHIQRLVNAVNAQLPGGVPPYSIRRTGSS